MKLRRNIGTPDRFIRLAIATGLFIDAVWQKHWLALAIAIFVFLEAIIGWCLLYQILGKNSCPINKK